MKIFDNITDIVRDDLKKTIEQGSKVSIAAACFSMYAYKELKSQLEQVEEFRFIFTSPTFVKEKRRSRKESFIFHGSIVKTVCMVRSLKSSCVTK